MVEKCFSWSRGSGQDMVILGIQWDVKEDEKKK